MILRRPQWGLLLGGLLLTVGLPVAAYLIRGRPEGRCAFDGSEIHPLYRVSIVDERGERREFCCIHCAGWWLEQQAAPPRAIYVTDEATGRMIAAADAVFVRSTAVTVAPTGNRLHAFAGRAAAERHVELFLGRVLEGSERPF
jgi:hypothetical protein